MKYVRFFLSYCLAASFSYQALSLDPIGKRDRLIKFVQEGRIDKIKKLLEKDYSNKLPEYSGNRLGRNRTILHLALEEKEGGIFRLLAANGNALHHSDIDKQTTLMLAAKNGDVKSVEFILARLQQNTKFLNQKSYIGGANALHYALKGERITAEQIKTSTRLINAGVDLYAFDSEGNTPFYEVLRHSKRNPKAAILVEDIIKKTNEVKGTNGYYINSQIPSEFTTPYKCYNNATGDYTTGHVTTKTKSTTPVMKACQLGVSEGVLKKLVGALGYKADIADIDGETALFYAARSGIVKNVQIIIKERYDQSYKNKKGQTVMDVVNEVGSPEMKKFFQKYHERCPQSEEDKESSTRRRLPVYK